ncbi:hypothetical protein ACGF7U_18100 [Micromonospora sp. NPDC047670]|uniref:hypothetical protein n=1 Tax=Micromonospora sp. NPDC047670 TaxID=3364252 RepID=UPI003710C661
MGEQEQELRGDEEQVEDDQQPPSAHGGRGAAQREPAAEGEHHGDRVSHRPGALEQGVISILPQRDQRPRDECEDPEGELQTSGAGPSAQPFLDDHATSVANGAVPRRRPIRESRSLDRRCFAAAAYNFPPTRTPVPAPSL